MLCHPRFTYGLKSGKARAKHFQYKCKHFEWIWKILEPLDSFAHQMKPTDRSIHLIYRQFRERQRVVHTKQTNKQTHNNQQNYNNMINICINWWRLIAINNIFIVPFFPLALSQQSNFLTCLVAWPGRALTSTASLSLCMWTWSVWQWFHANRFIGCMEKYDLEMLINFIFRLKTDDCLESNDTQRWIHTRITPTWDTVSFITLETMAAKRCRHFMKYSLVFFVAVVVVSFSFFGNKIYFQQFHAN